MRKQVAAAGASRHNSVSKGVESFFHSIASALGSFTRTPDRKAFGIAIRMTLLRCFH